MEKLLQLLNEYRLENGVYQNDISPCILAEATRCNNQTFNLYFYYKWQENKS